MVTILLFLLHFKFWIAFGVLDFVGVAIIWASGLGREQAEAAAGTRGLPYPGVLLLLTTALQVRCNYTLVVLTPVRSSRN